MGITSTWLQVLQQYQVFAVLRAPEMSLGLAMAQAVAKGGIRLIEVAWNSDHPTELVTQLREKLPDCRIGVGTILTPEQLTEAIASGAQFAFSPHVNPTLIETAVGQGIPCVAGALTPSEIVAAWQAGSTGVKVFPVSALGGARYIQSLQGPLGQIPLIPTGGVKMADAADFFAAGAIALGLSQDFFPESLIKARNWKAIAQRARRFNQQLSYWPHLPGKGRLAQSEG